MTDLPKPRHKKSIHLDFDNSVIEKYARGSIQDINPKKSKYKGLRLTLEKEHERAIKAAKLTAATQILLPSDKGFIDISPNTSDVSIDKQTDLDVDNQILPPKIFKLKQPDIVKHVDLNTAKNQFDLQLHNFGPYSVDYSRNGRHILLGGRKGHVAMLDCITMQVGAEMHLQEEVRDIKFLHNETMFAVAQKEYTYIYDGRGSEIHCVRNHNKPYKLDFLPYHFLLVSVGANGWVKWQDVSTGLQVGGYATGYGSCSVMKHNPHNSVSHLGHTNGVVTLWSPSSAKSLVTMFCHRSPVTDLAIDREGIYMATSGYDGMMKVWDLRMYRNIHTYRLDGPAMSLDISDTGLLAMGIGRNIQILKDPFSKPTDLTYLKHEIRAPNMSLSSGGGAAAVTKALKSSVQICSVRFRPLEDVCCAGHSHGVSSIIVPGAGEANFDAYEANPFRTLKQRREEEIQGLLQKLSPDMIALDSKFIGTVEKDNQLLQKEHQEIFNAANSNDTKKKPKTKNKMRGKNKIAARLRRKQKNVVDEQTVKLQEKLQEQKNDREKKEKPFSESPSNYDPLNRFEKKRKL